MTLMKATRITLMACALNACQGQSDNTELSAIKFKDPTFDQCVKSLGIRYVRDLKALDCSGRVLSLSPIKDLSGIESLHALRELRLTHSLIESVDLSSNTNLSTVNLSTNPLLKDVHFGENYSLRAVKLSQTRIQHILLDKLPLLEKLDLSENYYLNEIDLSRNSALRFLDLHHCQMPSIDLSGNPLIEALDLSQNFQLHTLDISKNSEISNLRLINTPLPCDDLENYKSRVEAIGGNFVSGIDCRSDSL